MNRLIYFKTIILAFLLFLFSCDKETAITLPTIGEVTYEVGYGEISFNWNFPQEQDVEYVRVDFSDEGEDKLYSFSRYAEDALIMNLQSREYTFSIRTADKTGHMSAPICINATPLEPAYKVVASSLKIEPVIGGVAVSWENPTGKDIQINVDYLDGDGVRQLYTSISSELTGKRYVLGVHTEEQVFSYYTSSPGNFLQLSEIKTASIKPYQEVRFQDKSEWIIVDFTSQSSQNEPPTRIFDDNLSTFWQTDWRAADPFPHHVTFDMLSSRIVTKLGFYNRDHNNAQNAPTDFIVEGSLDGVDWTIYGSYNDFPTTRNTEIIYSLDALSSIRYLRVTFSNPRNNVVFFSLAELYVYGAFL